MGGPAGLGTRGRRGAAPRRTLIPRRARRSYSYTTVESPFPVSAYESTIRVHPIPGRPDEAEVQWSGRFFPGTGTEAELETLFADIYRDGLAALSGTVDGR
ncbi:SRPBCC family protein [Tsukamurella hominis]|uniref:SRPBCC family protein n=1 Tax=Tsukamurella hominis TaxID=1970232 RepID=UPI0039EA8ABE